MVEPRGLEPLTLCLQSRCATNCAKAPVRPDGRGWLLRLQDRVGGFLPQRLLVLAGVDAPLGDDGHESGAGEEEKLLHDLDS